MSWRCSACAGAVGAAADAAGSAAGGLPASSDAIAFASRRRCPTDFTPISSQVFLGQLGQGLLIDVVVLERLDIALQSEVAKPCCDVHD